MTTKTSDVVRETNDAFAAFYDDFTSHHDDARWTGALEGLARDAGLVGGRLLDLGCGTGRSFMPMLDRGYEVWACDISPAMLEAAGRKAAGRVHLLEHDVRDLPRLGSFDLVWSLGDAFNYLQSAPELFAAISGAARNLAPGGLLVFDVNTLHTFRSVHAGLLVRASESRVLLLDGKGSPDLGPGGRVEVWIDRLEREAEERWSRVRTVHKHRHHPEEEVRAALDAAGLECAGVHGSHPTGDLESGLDELRHSKAVYVARWKRA